MNIQNRTYNPHFGAMHIANCGNLKLYKISEHADYNFLNALPINIHTEDLMPNLTRDEYKRWDEMLQYAVDNALSAQNETYIAAADNKICGIITFFPDNITKLDCICTWPVKFGKKVKLAGKTLFYQMFKDFQETIHGRKIKLEAIINGPYDTTKKYEELGFQKIIGTNDNEKVIPMEISGQKVKETLKQLSHILPYEEVPPTHSDLFIDIDV